jgi:hypothetical protein
MTCNWKFFCAIRISKAWPAVQNGRFAGSAPPSGKFLFYPTFQLLGKYWLQPDISTTPLPMRYASVGYTSIGFPSMGYTSTKLFNFSVLIVLL